mmetsp:Transcript_20533/g.45678  ORF Transcript_20533/g.45678 Transcript_20533/m.45678 type:complete len:422 (+) Transcript_20533:865-2130(+)
MRSLSLEPGGHSSHTAASSGTPSTASPTRLTVAPAFSARSRSSGMVALWSRDSPTASSTDPTGSEPSPGARGRRGEASKGLDRVPPAWKALRGRCASTARLSPTLATATYRAVTTARMAVEPDESSHLPLTMARMRGCLDRAASASKHTLLSSETSMPDVVSASLHCPTAPCARACLHSRAGRWLERYSEQKEPPWPSHTPKKLQAGRSGTGQLTMILSSITGVQPCASLNANTKFSLPVSRPEPGAFQGLLPARVLMGVRGRTDRSPGLNSTWMISVFLGLPLQPNLAEPRGVVPARSVGASSPTGSFCRSLCIASRRNLHVSWSPFSAARCRGVRPCRSRTQQDTPSPSSIIIRSAATFPASAATCMGVCPSRARAPILAAREVGRVGSKASRLRNVSSFSLVHVVSIFRCTSNSSAVH